MVILVITFEVYDDRIQNVDGGARQALAVDARRGRKGVRGP